MPLPPLAGSSPITSYSWNFGDGTSAGPSPDPYQTTIYNQAGSYQVTVVVTDENGQSSSATMGVTISTRLDTPVVWMLDSYANLGVLPGTAITLQFQAGQIAGFSGCNSYTGAYTATDNGDGTYSVTITGLVGTGMMCPGEIMDQEQTYLGLLSTVTVAQGEGNILDPDLPRWRLDLLSSRHLGNTQVTLEIRKAAREHKELLFSAALFYSLDNSNFIQRNLRKYRAGR